MNDENSSPSLPPNKDQKPPVIAVVIGLLPSLLMLYAKGQQPPPHFSSAHFDSLLWIVCGVSAVCCVVASQMLFSRGTQAAIIGGTVFFLLDAFIAFLSGCSAIIPN